MAKRNANPPVYEENAGSNRLTKVLCAVALYGIALLLAYIAVAPPQSGTAMAAIRGVLTGLAGHLAVVIPLFLGWIATLTALSAAGKGRPIWKSAVSGLLFELLLAAVQLFFVERVVRETGMAISGFANFVSKSYGFGEGGGALGALLAWPLSQTLGKWGGLLTTLLLALLCLTATGRAGQILRALRDGASRARHRSEQRRAERENEQMFEFDETPLPRAVERRPRRSGSDEPYAAMEDPFAKGRKPRAIPAGARRESERFDANGDARRGKSTRGMDDDLSMGRETEPAARGRNRKGAADFDESGANRGKGENAPSDGGFSADGASARPGKSSRRNKGGLNDGVPFEEDDFSNGIASANRGKGGDFDENDGRSRCGKSGVSDDDFSDDAFDGKTSERRRGSSRGSSPFARRKSGPEDEELPRRGRAAMDDDFDAYDDDFDLPEPEDPFDSAISRTKRGKAPQSGSKLKTNRNSSGPDDALCGAAEGSREGLARNKSPRGYKPDTSESVEALRRAKAKDMQLRMDDDLTIEPEKSDVLSGDDAPFSAPAPKKPLGKLKRPVPAAESDEDEYYYPPIDLLAEGERTAENHHDGDMEKAGMLVQTLQQFGIETKLTGIAHGPAVTRFELQPAPGVKVSRITSLSDDIAMRLAAMSVRIEAPIPGKAAVGVEIPNEKVEMVRLRDVLESPEARKSVSKVAVGLGKDNSGRYIVADIAKMPHVLIAGQTGSGKSVCINSIITSILFRATPDEVRLILIDPKVVELSIYNDIPHLVCPVVTDCKKASGALDWAVAEMGSRYKRFAERGVRDIKGYNKELRDGEKPMPQMVIIIDELADLMMVAPGEVEDSICRLAQLARAAGMHLVIATQRPSVNVITGIIKANIPTRIAFSVASQIDSRTMIDHGGAEKLLGNGDMLFVPSGINKPMRVQGAWVSDEEVHAVVSYIKERSATAYDADMMEQMDNAARTDAEKEEYSEEYDPRLPEAVEIVVEAGQASVSMLQRRMRVGYARAGRLIDEMEQRGIVSEADGAKPRAVLISREEMASLFE